MISRRRFLQVTGAAIATSTLAACGDGGAANGGAKASGELKLPTYKPFEGLHAGLPGGRVRARARVPEVPGGRRSRACKAPPLKSAVTALTETFATPPPPMGSNPMWQALNQALGA